jgi:hypothetical protein
MRILLACLAVLPLATPAAMAQVVHGRVLDSTTEAPVPAAVVRLRTGDAERAADADTLGQFVLAAPRDTAFRLEASAPGYREVTATERRLARGDSLEVILRLSADTVVLEPLEVVAVRRRRSAQIEAFYARARLRAQGWFVMRDQIESRSALRTTDLLRRAPGIRLVETRGGVGVRGRGNCIPAVYLDALPISPGVVDHWIRPDDLEGIEVYTAGMSPPEYVHRRTVCALILLWTHQE